MKLEDAIRLNAEGKLDRKVLTEQGWYTPSGRSEAVPEAPVGDGPPPPRFLPPVKKRKPRKVA